MARINWLPGHFHYFFPFTSLSTGPFVILVRVRGEVFRHFSSSMSLNFTPPLDTQESDQGGVGNVS